MTNNSGVHLYSISISPVVPIEASAFQQTYLKKDYFQCIDSNWYGCYPPYWGTFAAGPHISEEGHQI